MSASAAEHVVPAPGVPCWVNLMVGDLPAATAFYTAVLGWEFHPSLLGGQFLVASQDGSPVAGIGARRPGLAPASVWTPYFAVRDADVTAARIKERGATLAVGPIALGDGRAGLAADRDGATFGFWQGPTLAWVYGQAGAAPPGSTCGPGTRPRRRRSTRRSSAGPRNRRSPSRTTPTGSWSSGPGARPCRCAGERPTPHRSPICARAGW